METIIFATGNKGKFDHIASAIGSDLSFTLVMKKPSAPEIQSASVREVCLHKAQEAFKEFGQPVLVHDAGLKISALNGFPGAYFKDFITVISQQVLHEMFGHFTDKRLSLESWLVFIDSNGNTHEFTHETGDMLCLGNNLGSDTLSTHPLNNLISFSDKPDIPASDDVAFMNRYDERLIENGIIPCWTQFRQFITQKEKCYG